MHAFKWQNGLDRNYETFYKLEVKGPEINNINMT